MSSNLTFLFAGEMFFPLTTKLKRARPVATAATWLRMTCHPRSVARSLVASVVESASRRERKDQISSAGRLSEAFSYVLSKFQAIPCFSMCLIGDQ